MRTIGVVVVALVVASCGDPRAARTVSGPRDSKLDVPAGALSAPADLSIAIVTSGFPAMPSSAASTSSVFALTPHGQTFEQPVTISIPAEPGQTRLLTAQRGGTWEVVPGSMRVGSKLVAKVSHFSFFAGTSESPTRAVFGDGPDLRELDLADGGVRMLVAGVMEQNYVTGVALDGLGRAYWVDNVLDTLTRLELDGGQTTLHTASNRFDNPEGLAVDSMNGYVFWAQAGDVLRCNLDDGSDVTSMVLAATGAYAVSVAVDPVNGVLFWTDNAADTVNRIAYDRTGRSTLHTAIDSFSNPRGLSFDASEGRLFWTEGFEVVSMPVSGGTVSTIVPSSNLTFPTATTFDVATQRLYWTDNGTDTVSRVNADGSNPEQLYVNVSPLSNPQGVALGP